MCVCLVGGPRQGPKVGDFRREFGEGRAKGRRISQPRLGTAITSKLLATEGRHGKEKRE